MDRVAERIIHGGDFRSDAPFIHCPQIFCRYFYIFRENSIYRDAEYRIVQANMLFADPALVASSASHMRVAGHQRADLNLGAIFWIGIGIKPFDHRSLLHDLAEKLMPS